MILHCEFSIYSIIFIHKLTKDYNLSVRIIFVANMLLESSHIEVSIEQIGFS